MSVVKLEFDPKNMPFRRLGPSGLRVPVFSLGGWLTLGGTVTGDPVKDIVKVAFENGINMFDTAEAYAKGKSEEEMGRVIKELGLRRTDLIITTKLFWGVHGGPNDGGLSRKHIVEGTKESLERLGLDYVDVIFAHRPDVSGKYLWKKQFGHFSWVIEKGWAHYWATSEWSAYEIEEAHHIATKFGLHAPIAEQCQHNMFHRERPEKEYRYSGVIRIWECQLTIRISPLYRKYELGTTVFSALASGLLTGKYNNGVSEGTRFAMHSNFFKGTVDSLQKEEGLTKIRKVKELSTLAEQALSSLAHPDPNRFLDNLKALEVIPKLTPEILDKIEAILENKPAPPPTFGRPPLDPLGRL
ncbi:NADP-dependent oxidoreductase domain-containing protein [Lanmaoa asiatica]|nr:NADP-dependent oxidoreductase domain-containing protein [Lanmaoa asiatica]